MQSAECVASSRPDSEPPSSLQKKKTTMQGGLHPASALQDHPTGADKLNL